MTIRRPAGTPLAKNAGPRNGNWKGDHAPPKTKRERAVRRFALGPCEECSAPGTDRHHIDGDTGHNERPNIAILCRSCHMKADGRLAALVKHGTAKKGQRTLKPCSVCSRPANPLRRGRCNTCRHFFEANGYDGKPTWKEGARRARWG